MEPGLVLLPRVAYRDREVASRRLQHLLALLAGSPQAGVSTGHLVEEIWPEAGPEHPAKAVQVLVSRARALLGHDAVASTPTGYRLAVPAEQVDVMALRAAAAEVRTLDAAGALRLTEAALTLWEGEATGDGPPRDLRAECVPARAVLLRACGLALARTGRAAEALDLLDAVARDAPHDEEVLAALLRAEAAALGPAAALVRYDRHRRALRDELGTDPGPVLQAVHAELLAADTPAVRTGVVHDPNPLLGREADLAAVRDLMGRSRVVSLVGPGGLGKTRLASAVARQASQRVVCFVGLAGVTRDGDVAGEVASSVAAPALQRGPVDAVTVVLEALRGGLLVLDNCEHVLEGAAALVAALIARAPEVQVLTTSRAPLGLSSEAVYALPPLPEPVAVELFAQRARAARPDAELPPDDVRRICRSLDGLPLAVELAAARVRTLSVAQIADRMTDRFALLQGGPRDAPARHRTLSAVVDWSWALLSPADRAALAALSLFPDGFGHAAARRLSAADSLERLVDQSLLTVGETPDGVRFRMLETVREFVAPRRSDGDVEAYLAWARDLCLAEYGALFGPEPFAAVALVRLEQDNLLQALRVAAQRGDEATLTATAAALLGLWTVENSFSRVFALTQDIGPALSHVRPTGDLVEALRTAAVLDAANRLSLYGPRASRALVVLRRLPPAPPDTFIRAVSFVLGRPAPEVLALSEHPEPLVSAVARGMSSYLYEADGRPEAALAAARGMADTAGRAHPLLLVMAMSRLGELLLLFEEGREASLAFDAALAAYARLAPTDTVGLRWASVQAALQAGDVEEAQRRLDAATALGVRGSYGVLTISIALRGELRLLAGDVDAGLALWRRAVAALADEPQLPISEDAPDPWACELRSAAVVAHARAARLDDVADLADGLVAPLAHLLAHPLRAPLPSFSELSLSGTLLVALASADLARGERLPAVRMIALAERMRFSHNFHPTMSSAGVRTQASAADAGAYEQARADYAGLGPDELRRAGLDLLAQRRGSRL